MRYSATWRFVVGLAVWLSLAPPAQSAEPDGDGFIPLFNGRDLTDWDGAPGWWEIRGGAIVGESTPDRPCQQSHYLYWKGGEPGDFDLRATYRITGEANSGIQFRSEPRPNHDTWGYQADLDTAGQYTGCLYQHERGLVAERGQRVAIDDAGQREVTSIGDSAELLKSVRPGEWNKYRILAQGSSIKLWINDVLMCEVDDHQERFAQQRGIIALQMHQGPPMKVEWKDLRIRLLDSP